MAAGCGSAMYYHRQLAVSVTAGVVISLVAFAMVAYHSAATAYERKLCDIHKGMSASAVERRLGTPAQVLTLPNNAFVPAPPCHSVARRVAIYRFGIEESALVYYDRQSLVVCVERAHTITRGSDWASQR